MKQVASLWKKLGYRNDIESAEKMACYGCSSSTWCRYGVKECALENKVDNCGRCNKYPCDRTDNMFQRAFNHAQQMKKLCSAEEYEFMLNAVKDKKYNLDREHELFLQGK